MTCLRATHRQAKQNVDIRNNQIPRNNNQTITNNQIQITKQRLSRQFDYIGNWNLEFIW
jgi:hypothetical protein